MMVGYMNRNKTVYSQCRLMQLNQKIDQTQAMFGPNVLSQAKPIIDQCASEEFEKVPTDAAILTQQVVPSFGHRLMYNSILNNNLI